MNSLALAFLIINGTAILLLPRRWALIPLLASCFYMTTGQGVEIGPVSLPMYRMALLIGLLRVLIRREGIVGGITIVDKLVVAWATWVLIASLFHERLPGSGPLYAVGFVGTILVIYLLVRVWCRDTEELMMMIRIMAWLLIPVAVAMTLEHRLYRNLFGVLGGVPEGVFIRDGAVRAQGPFTHPILAGTVGAVCVPLMVAIWQRYRVSAIAGLAACVVMVVASTSSGPLMSLFIGVLAILMWPIRDKMAYVRWALLGAYVSAEILMTRPAYYLVSKFNLTGSSTGWYRSRLIESAIEHLGEWWVFGTDRTAHWMPFQPPLPGGRHSDIPNYYLFIGTIGGLPALLLVVAVIWCSFMLVGRTIRSASSAMTDRGFTVWCLGAGLAAHASTSISVSYTDQSMMFFWLNVGIISSMFGALVVQPTSLSRSLSVGQVAPGPEDSADAKPTEPPTIRPKVFGRRVYTESRRARHGSAQHTTATGATRARQKFPIPRK